jgi:hypothetical protein
MNIHRAAILISLLALALAGCATITPEDSAITRFVPAPAAVLSRCIADAAGRRNFRPIADGRWEYVAMREIDPVVGRAIVREKAQMAIRFSASIEGVTPGTSRLTVHPTWAMKHYLSDEYTEVPLSPRGDDHARVVGLVDAAIADAVAEYAKQSAAVAS